MSARQKKLEGMPDETWPTERLLKLLSTMPTSVKVVSGDLQRGFERSNIADDGRVFGYAADPSWLRGVADRLERAADLVFKRFRAAGDSLEPPAGAEPSERLRALAVEWREEAQRFEEAATSLLSNRAGAQVAHEKRRVRDAYLHCAHELDAALRSADPRLRPSLDWQPMESVPRDGQWVWMRRDPKLTKREPRQPVSAFKWDESNKNWFAGTGWWPSVDQWFTHWAPMPLPPLPSPQAK